MLWRRSLSLTALCGLLTATSTLFTSSVSAETVIVPVSPPSFMAEKKEPKYLITMSKDLPESEEISAGERDGDVVMMTDKNGQRYACKLPVLQGDGETSENEDEMDSSSADILNRPKTVSELLDSLGKACFFRVEGWWTYELCYHKHVRQYHSEREQVLSEFFLGHYDEEATKEFHAAQPNPEYVEDGGLGLSQRFHTHIYTNGTKCDLTGEGRRTEVRFGCSPENSNNVLVSIKEPTTCRYVVVFYSPILCTHAAFRVQESPMEYINCQAVPSEVKKDVEGSTEAGREGNHAGEPSETAEIGDMSVAADIGTSSEASSQDDECKAESASEDHADDLVAGDEVRIQDLGNQQENLQKDYETLQALHKKLKDSQHPALQQVTTALETVEGKLAAKREARYTENTEASTLSSAEEDHVSKESDATQYPRDIIKTDEILKNEQE